MPRDPLAPQPPMVLVTPLPHGPLGPRFRVRGLRGQPSLAAWLERSMAVATGTQARASADSGIVRISWHGQGQDEPAWEALLTAAVHAYGLATPARPHRPRTQQRRTGLKTASPVPEGPQAARPVATTSTAPVGAATHHDQPLARLLSDVDATTEGLSAASAAERLRRQGPNEIADITARGDLEILLSQFKSVPVALLAGSGAMALATRAFGDAAAIGAVLAANGGIGYVTERRAEQTVSALRRLAPRDAIVRRGGREVKVPAREVVVGDILVLKPGEHVAADARVLEAHRLSANEAPLTGESLPVRKQPLDALPADTPLGERSNMLHMGTVISGGTGLALVVATGERTVLGAIRGLAQTAEAPRTRMQEELDGLGKKLAIGASALCGGLFAVGLLRGRPAVPLLRTAVSLGVAAIPEGLPTVATSLLASGIRTLQKRNVYARSLDAVENLGAIDVVGFDKTGTLTQNRMTVAGLLIGAERLDPANPALRLPADWALVGALCNELEPSAAAGGWEGSSTEVALVNFLEGRGARAGTLRQRHPRLAIKQRSEHHPYMVTLHADGTGALVAMKGRPEEVLERCSRWFDGRRVAPLTAAQRRRLLAENDHMAAQGQRVLALAVKRQPTRVLGKTASMTWLGLVGLSDPVRPGVADSIARFKAAGIRPVMLTGDQMGTAEAVARQIGLDGAGHVADAAALPEDARQLRDVVEHSTGFARSSPGMKLSIIRALQAAGHTVAMTGDGINDGPALKTADVGVAMGASGTDFAQAMSDLVLKDDHPDGLLAAIAEGRTAYLNVKKAVRYLIATNVSELALMGTAVAAGLPDPLDPLALLWTNLITDVSPAIALGLEPPEPDILQRPPFPRSSALLSGAEWRGVAVDGGMITAAALAAFSYGVARYGPSPRAKTLAFTTLTSAQLVYALSARSESPLALLGKGRLRRNPWLMRTVVISLGLQAATVAFPPLRALLRTTPLGLADVAVVGALALAPTVAREALKRVRARPPGAPLDAAVAVPASVKSKTTPVRRKAAPRRTSTKASRR